MIELHNYMGEIIALITAVVWAFAVILFKRSGESVHPIALNLFKGCLAFVLLIPTILIFSELPSSSTPIVAYIALLVSGILGVGIADTLFFVGLNNLGAGLSAIAGCVYSPAIILLSYIFLGESLTVVQFIGVIAILSAIFTANFERAKLPPGNWKRGIISAISANIAIVLSVIIIKPYLDILPLLWLTEIRIFGGILALFLFLIFSPRRRLILGSLKSAGSFKFTLSGAIIGTYLAMIFWIAGMKFTQASTAAALNQTSNIFIFILAGVFLKERITPLRILGIVLAVGGAILVSLGK